MVRLYNRERQKLMYMYIKKKERKIKKIKKDCKKNKEKSERGVYK